MGGRGACGASLIPDEPKGKGGSGPNALGGLRVLWEGDVRGERAAGDL